MSLLTFVVAAEEDEAQDVVVSAEPLVEWSGVQVAGLDTGKVTMLHCLLTGDEFDFAVSHYEPVMVTDDEGPLLLCLAHEAQEVLAHLDEDALAQVAEELAATEVFEEDGWDGDQTYDLLLDLADLARLADSQGQVLFIWMRPEGTRRVDE